MHTSTHVCIYEREREMFYANLCVYSILLFSQIFAIKILHEKKILLFALNKKYE
jgi:hypothetical protein